MQHGYLPTTLQIYSRAPDMWHLDAMADAVGFNPSIQVTATTIVKGRKGFAVDKDKNKGDDSTASRWANAKPVKARSRIALIFDDVEDTCEERQNDPMKGLRIFYLEHRAEGGRAYKVIDEDGYVWDFREDVLMEVMVTVGISPGGILNGEYVFGVVGSQMKLVRVGSQLYKDLTAGSDRKAKKAIGKDTLEIGGVYRSKGGKLAMFCGYSYTSSDPKKKFLWYEVPTYKHLGDRVELPKDWLDNYFWFKATNSHTYVECVTSFDVPDDLIAQIRARYIQRTRADLQNQLDRDAAYRRSPSWGRTHASTSPATFWREREAWATLTRHGDPLNLPEDLRPFFPVAAA